SRCGQLGVVSGTAIDSLFVRRLQDGDPGGALRRAMEHFPMPSVSSDALKRYFLPEGRAEGAPYRMLSMWREKVTHARERITMLASFAEVWLAKEGHSGQVGMNLLTKVQMPNLATLYGAMLAGVDYVLMGAGIPQEIPGVLDAFSAGEPATMKLHVEGQPRGERTMLRLDPADHFDSQPPALHRPAFLPIVSAHSLATMLQRKSNGRVDGFVVEAPIAGGHNAPPRGRMELDAAGEPVYGARDQADLAVMRDLGLPFWLAGGTGTPEGVEAARAAGAAGVQVGTLFAMCEESGLDPSIRATMLEKVRGDEAEVRTDARASPTGFPFKVMSLEDTNSDQALYERRERVCDLGYLREPYHREDGRIGYRCAAEPVATYLKKEGTAEETAGRKCLCNGLMANVGHPQARGEEQERALITTGEDLTPVRRLLDGRDSYSATEAVAFLLQNQQA
ncbi:MAG TPA: nitronate monooxygenase, partial [Longimicrobiales bacterium]|nr:nitronate monooxygenase [Longimicrobiales bacterium]